MFWFIDIAVPVLHYGEIFVNIECCVAEKLSVFYGIGKLHSDINDFYSCVQ